MTPGYHRAVRDFKRQTIRAALARHQNSRTLAARDLGLARTYLHRLMRDLKGPLTWATTPEHRSTRRAR